MKQYYILLSLLLLTGIHTLKSQTNIDFENGTNSGWTITGTNTILSSGNDPNFSSIPCVYPGGGNYSIRMGDYKGSSGSGGTLTQTFTVTAANSSFIYHYAVVLEDGNHSKADQPYFQIKMYDKNNKEIDCTVYDVNASTSTNVGGFTQSGSFSYKDWTTVLVPLDAYIGQKVTIEFIVGWCVYDVHMGYAYIDCETAPLGLLSSSPITCGGQPITLTAPAGAQQYSWTGPGGFNANSQVVSVTDPGTYYCTILSKNTSGVYCTSKLDIAITGNPNNPVADFTADNTCLGTVSQFTDQSSISGSTITSWLWDFGDGTTSTQQNPTHTYAVTGNYSVTLTVTTAEGCDATTTQTISISQAPMLVISSTDEKCGLKDGTTTATILGGSGSYNYQWNTTPMQTTVTAKGLAAGTYTVTVDDGNCIATGNATVSNIAGPALTVNSTDEYCGASDGTVSVNASGGSGSYTYQWNTSPVQTTATASGLKAGSYTVTVNDGICSATGSINVNALAAPTLSFTTTKENCGASDGTATVTASGGSGTYTYIWNTTPVQTSNSASALVAGTYTVTVNDGNCNVTGNATVTSNNTPVLFVSKTDANCESVDGTATAIVSGGSGTYSYSWDTSPIQTTNVISNLSAGTYTVTVNDGICPVSASVSITTNAKPFAGFSFNNVCQYDDAIFTNSSTITTGSISNYQWDFGDGTTSSLQSPGHQYAIAGTYNTTLITFSGSGCSDTLSQNITIYGVPQAAISTNNECDKQAVPFTDATNTNGTVIASYQWDFGNGGSSTEQNPNITFPASGFYNTQLIITTTDGCVDTANSNVQIYPLPIVDYTTNNVCLNDQNTFTNLTYLSNGSVASWQWNFGNGNFSNNQSPAYIYSSDGKYNVTLVATTDMGCIDSITQVLTIYPLPVVDFIADKYNGCVGLDINFTNISTISSTSIQSYLWDMGDGTTSDLTHPLYTYPIPGTYNVTLVATSDKGCIDISDYPVTIEAYSLPKAGFSFSPDYISILNPIVEFTDLSIDAVSWNWYLGDETVSTLQDPTHTYADTGNYQVWLTVANQYGCVDSISEIIRVNPNSIVYIPSAFTPNGNGKNDLFTAKGLGIIDYKMDIFDRWGNKIYSTIDINSGWDGMIESSHKPAQEDVYVYHVTVRNVLDETNTYIGRVSLIR